MEISQIFILKVNEISSNKDALIELMNQLDEEKRSIKSFMRKYSNEPKSENGGAGSERYIKLRRLKDRQSYLIIEREYVRQKLGSLKGDVKSLNRIVNSKNIALCHAFMAAAERMLDDDIFAELEAKAVMILETVSQS